MMGITSYQDVERRDGAQLTDPTVDALRAQWGGQLAPIPFVQTRWFQKDLEFAQQQADAGSLQTAAQLWNSGKRDGVVAGVLSTRTNGLVRLPKRFRGGPDMVRELELGHDSVRSVFDEMHPPAELAMLAEDGIGLGVGVGELAEVQGRDYPILIRLPPENLIYYWSRNRWYYRSVAGLVQITPGDGRWVLHLPGGRVAPWQNGIWRAVGRAFIQKEHALLCDLNWQGKLANPARVAYAPAGSTDDQISSWFAKVAAWGINTVFGMKPGWDVKLLESNGRGHESFDTAVKRAEREMIIAIAGQEVTTDGGAGFSNANIHSAIRSDLIKATADALAYTLNTQSIPQWVERRWGEEALANSPCVEWDVSPARDKNSEATATMTTASAIDKSVQIAERVGLVPNVLSFKIAIEKSTGIDFELAPAGEVEVAKLDLAPADIAMAVKVSEVRASQHLPPLHDERDDMMLSELKEKAKAPPGSAPGLPPAPPASEPVEVAA
jgi:phage gp29-like protein